MAAVAVSAAAGPLGAGEAMHALTRTLRHLSFGHLALRRSFGTATLDAIEAAVKACEARHSGEIRFAVEASLPPAALWRGQTPRERAQQVFSDLRVWDTAHNNGVLIYVLVAERDVEIVADRGVGGPSVPAAWEACCRIMEDHFRAGRFREGSVAGIEAVAAVLAGHPPNRPDAGNELPDAAAVL